MPLPDTPWRRALRPASFRGVGFHVEVGGQAGGRRGPTHEFPNRDQPFSEDLGRKARRRPITGYIIGADYLRGRDALIAACEAKGPGTLVHPTLGAMQAKCDGYAVTESRERGGICVVELLFVEQGSLDPNTITNDTRSQVGAAAASSDAAAASSLNTSLGGSGGIGSDTVSAHESLASGTPLGAGGIGRN